jgi:putative transposase
LIRKESEAGLGTAELCRKRGISEQTFYRWKAKYGGLEVSEAQRLRQLEEENRKLSRFVGGVRSKSSIPVAMSREPSIHILGGLEFDFHSAPICR